MLPCAKHLGENANPNNFCAFAPITKAEALMTPAFDYITVNSSAPSGCSFLRVLLNALCDLFCGDLDPLLGEVDVVRADVGGDVGIDG